MILDLFTPIRQRSNDEYNHHVAIWDMFKVIETVKFYCLSLNPLVKFIITCLTPLSYRSALGETGNQQG